MRWRDEIKSLRVTWLQLEAADSVAQRLQMTWHCFDDDGEQLPGLGCSWSQELREMSSERLALVMPLVHELRGVAWEVLRQQDPWYEGQDAALRLIQVGRYPEVGIGINIARYYDNEDEFIGQLAFEQRASYPMKLNQRKTLRTEDQAVLQASLEKIMAQADQLAWKLRVEGVK